ncbi:MAG: acyl-CoA desaturase [Moraxellaceae bacterium]|nr:acyl-CoA desaturase [Moraxellaceae bacterium]
MTLTAAATPRLSPAQSQAFGAELDAIRARIRADLGAGDLAYIRRLIRVQRMAEIGGRLFLFMGFNPVAFALGVALLSLSKILDNMEIGHNIMHGQFDWTNDPQLRGRTFEWDSACPGDQWRHSHNFIHHTYTNIIGKDRDVGYGILRMTEEQPWKVKHLFQPVRAFIMMLIFEWGVAMHDLEMDRVRTGERSWDEVRPQFRQSMRKMGRQALKDYVVFPLLAFPIFTTVLLGNLAANVVRNIWAFIIIFCGHFTDQVAMFSEEETRNETKGEWYVRQLLGSCNIQGSKWFHILSGNLSHQIEHHLFPDIPANRYADIAVEVRALCAKYNLPYNTGSLTRQFATVILRILRMSLPGKSGTRNPVTV